MFKILRLALKNLLRYKRRTFLTGLLIVVGVVAVIVFSGLSGSFKQAIVGQITDSVLSHLQVHRKGYMSSIDNLPLDRMMPSKAFEKLEGLLAGVEEIEAYSPRIKFGAMLSNYTQTTNARLNGIDPAKERMTVPLLASRIKDAAHDDVLLKPGEVLLPEILARGMDLKTGDTVVLVANNKDGSVNGMTFMVAGIVESLMGPGGRDGYLHISDAAALLRMETPEISEMAIRVRDFGSLKAVAGKLNSLTVPLTNKQGGPMFELHTWDQLTPFYNIVRMIDIMTLGIRVILIAVVLISVLNVMMMSVYERVREIGTLAGSAIGAGILRIMNLTGVDVTFGNNNQVFTLAPSTAPAEVALTCLIVLGVSVLASLQPAAKAAGLEPVEALRHV